MTSGSPELWWQKKHYYIAWYCTKSKRWYLYGCLSYHSPSKSPAHHQRSPEEQHGMTPPISEGRQCTPQVARCYRWWTAVHQCPRRSRTVSRRGCHGLTSPSSASSTTSWTGKCTWTVGPCNTSMAWLQFFFFGSFLYPRERPLKRNLQKWDCKHWPLQFCHWPHIGQCLQS